ncbi:MAG: YIP1 family protein [Paracoccaceae bacterium]
MVLKAQPSEAGFIARVLTAWLDLRASMRSILASNPSEGRILSFAMLSGVVLFAGRALALLSGTERLPQGVPMEAAFASGLLFQVIAWPLVLFGLAALIASIARAVGGRGGWREPRAAVAWAAIVQAPADVLLTLPVALGGVPQAVASVLGALSAFVFAAVLSFCIAEAHEFSRVRTVFAVLGGVTALLWAGVLFLVS